MTTSNLMAAQPCLPIRTAARIRQPARNNQNRRLATVMLIGLTMLGATPAFAKDPCKTVLCMYGRFTGNSGGSECNTAEQDYFDILIKKHGDVRWGKTSTARGQFLNSCPGADGGINNKINDKFGKVMG